MQTFGEAIRKFDRSVWLYLLYWATIGFCYFGVQAVLLNLYYLRLGYGLEFIGLLTGMGQAMWGLAALPAGTVSGRIGLKRAMILALVLVAGGMFAQLMAETLPRGAQVPVLVGATLVMWTGSAFLAVGSLPYLMAVTTSDIRSYAFSAQQAAMAIFGFAGSMVAGVVPGWVANWLGVTLEHPAPYRLTLFIIPAVYIGVSFAFRNARDIPTIEKSTSAGEKQALPWGVFVFLTLLVILQTSGEGALRTFFNVYLDQELGVPTVQIGTVMALAALAPVLAAGVAPGLLIRWGGRTVMMLSAAGAAFSLLLIALAPWWVAAAAGLLMANCLIGLLTIGRNLFFQETVAPQLRTISSAIITIGLAAGWGISAAGGGYLAGMLGFRGVFLLGAAITLLSAGMLLTRAQPVPDIKEAIPATGEQAEG